MSKYINIRENSIQFDDRAYINQPIEIIDYILELQNRITELEQINQEHQKINGELRQTENNIRKYIEKDKLNIDDSHCYIETNTGWKQIPEVYDDILKILNRGEQ